VYRPKYIIGVERLTKL